MKWLITALLLSIAGCDDGGSEDSSPDADFEADTSTDTGVDTDADIDADIGADVEEIPDADEPMLGCPGRADMILILTDTLQFCIDKYEAYRRDGNIAGSEEGRTPWTDLTYADATVACAQAGKRLCTPEEWQTACRGRRNRDYPYGREYNCTACNGRDRDDSVVPTGTIPTCEGGYPGLFDMSGNVSEWTSSCDMDYCRTSGGSVEDTEPTNLTCGAETELSPTTTSNTVGFRCCTPF